MSVPRFAELSAKNLYGKVLSDPVMRSYLPEPSVDADGGYIGICREFLYNIINTIDETFFERNIPEAYKKRKEAQLERK